MAKWKILVLLLPLFASITTALGAEVKSVVSDSLTRFNIEMVDVYKNQSGYRLSTSLQNDFLSIEFCSDNVCDEFKLPVASSLNSAYDFLYLFEYSIPSDSELDKKWKNRKDVIKYVSRLMNRYRSLAQCNSNDDEKDQRICAMRYLIASQHIKIYIVRYDEGERIGSITDLDEFLKRV